MKKEKGLIIGLMAFFLVSGGAACIVRQYRDGQENVLAPVYVYQDRQLPQTTKEPESEPEKVPVQEEPVQPENEPTEEEQPEIRYYVFTVRGDISSLNIRIAPGMDGRILGRLMPGQTGYVLEQGEEWSLVTTGVKSGYVNNGYIELEEIPEEDFPGEYRD